MTNESSQFAVGDPITIVGGPYTDFKGVVTHAAPAPGKVGIKLAFFGRKAPITLDASLVKPLRKKQ